MVDENKKTIDEANAILVEEARSAREHERAAVFELLHALRDVATAELSTANGITGGAWRKLHDTIAEVLGEDQAAQAVPVPGRPAFVVPPARGGATVVPHRPALAVPPTPRGPQPIGAPMRTESAPVSVVPPPAGDIRQREDVAAELERVKRGGK